MFKYSARLMAVAAIAFMALSGCGGGNCALPADNKDLGTWIGTWQYASISAYDEGSARVCVTSNYSTDRSYVATLYSTINHKETVISLQSNTATWTIQLEGHPLFTMTLGPNMYREGVILHVPGQPDQLQVTATDSEGTIYRILCLVHEPS